MRVRWISSRESEINQSKVSITKKHVAHVKNQLFPICAAKPPGVVTTQTAGIQTQASENKQNASIKVSMDPFLSSEESRKISMKTNMHAGRRVAAATKRRSSYCILGMLP
mmetsp:Transcript_1072/g.2174  ORF Transcript_1072/g.2174 Transcript_1072/m.2174 type:complete len:110 (-) Transcript_1072:220-549(-)